MDGSGEHGAVYRRSVSARALDERVDLSWRRVGRSSAPSYPFDERSDPCAVRLRRPYPATFAQTATA